MSKQDWPLYEIFIRAKAGLSHRHVGSLHAADASLAIDHVRDLYTRRGEGCFIKKGVEALSREICSTRMVKHLHQVAQEAKTAGIPKKDLTAVITKSMTLSVNPYEEVPKAVLKLAGSGRKGGR